MKIKLNVLLSFLIIILLISCSHVRGALGISNKEGTSVSSYDEQSSKNIDNTFNDIIENDKHKDAIIELCKEFNINVSYNDKARMTSFKVNTSNFYVTVTPNNCQLSFYGRYDIFNKSTLVGTFSGSSYQGFLNPNAIVFESYGTKKIQKLNYEDVKEYGSVSNGFIVNTVDTRGEEVDCVLSKDIQKFLREDWVGGKSMYVTLNGSGSNKFEKELQDVDNAVVTIYRYLYEVYNEYEYLKDASYEEIIDVISSINSLSINKANLLKNFIILNNNIRPTDQSTIFNFIQNKTK